MIFAIFMTFAELVARSSSSSIFSVVITIIIVATSAHIPAKEGGRYATS